MSSLAFMAKPTNENKLTARTAPHVVEGVKLVVLKMANKKIKFRNRNVGIEGLIGAVMLEFLERPDAEQEKMLRSLLPRLESMFEAEEEASPTELPEEPDAIGSKSAKPRRKGAG